MRKRRGHLGDEVGHGTSAPHHGHELDVARAQGAGDDVGGGLQSPVVVPRHAREGADVRAAAAPRVGRHTAVDGLGGPVRQASSADGQAHRDEHEEARQRHRLRLLVVANNSNGGRGKLGWAGVTKYA